MDIDDVLNKAFPMEHADLQIVDGPLVWEILRNQIRPSSTSMETPQEQRKLTKQIFGSDYHKEYGAPVVRQVLRDHARELGRPQHQPKRKI